eukprot:1875982-Prymnesium_polylepis.1
MRGPVAQSRGQLLVAALSGQAPLVEVVDSCRPALGTSQSTPALKRAASTSSLGRPASAASVGRIRPGTSSPIAPARTREEWGGGALPCAPMLDDESGDLAYADEELDRPGSPLRPSMLSRLEELEQEKQQQAAFQPTVSMASS